MKKNSLVWVVILTILAAGCAARQEAPTIVSPTETVQAAPSRTSTTQPTPTIQVPPTFTAKPSPTIQPLPTVTTTPSAEVLILLAWIDAFNRQDIETFMSYVAEDARLDRGPHGTAIGAEAIRKTLLEEFEEPVKAYILWWSVDGNAVIYGSYVRVGRQRIDSCPSIMIIEDGKILSDMCAP